MVQIEGSWRKECRKKGEGVLKKMPDMISSTGRCRTLQKGVIPSCLPAHTLWTLCAVSRFKFEAFHTHKNKHCIMGLKQWANKSSLCQINIQNDLIFFYIHGTVNQSLLKLPGWLSEGYGKDTGSTQALEMLLHNTCMVVQNFCWVTLQKVIAWTLKHGHWGHMEIYVTLNFYDLKTCSVADISRQKFDHRSI